VRSVRCAPWRVRVWVYELLTPASWRSIERCERRELLHSSHSLRRHLRLRKRERARTNRGATAHDPSLTLTSARLPGYADCTHTGAGMMASSMTRRYGSTTSQSSTSNTSIKCVCAPVACPGVTCVRRACPGVTCARMHFPPYFRSRGPLFVSLCLSAKIFCVVDFFPRACCALTVALGSSQLYEEEDDDEYVHWEL
jgi:hypothetical protein